MPRRLRFLDLFIVSFLLIFPSIAYAEKGPLNIYIAPSPTGATSIYLSPLSTGAKALHLTPIPGVADITVCFVNNPAIANVVIKFTPSRIAAQAVHFSPIPVGAEAIHFSPLSTGTKTIHITKTFVADRLVYIENAMSISVEQQLAIMEVFGLL